MMLGLVSLQFSFYINLLWWHRLLFPGQNYMQGLWCHMYTQRRKRCWQFDSQQWYTARMQGANLYSEDFNMEQYNLLYCLFVCDHFLTPFQDNIISVDEIVPNQISSSRVRYQSYRNWFVDNFMLVIWIIVFGTLRCIYVWLNFRDCIKRCLSIKYLTCDEVIEYIREHKLFMEAEGGDTRLW